MFARNGYFSSTRSISVAVKYAFLKNNFYEPKLAKTLFISIK